IGLLSACAQAAGPSVSVDPVQAAAARYRALSTDPAVAPHAEVALYEAGRIVDQALAADAEGEGNADHLAYLAERQMDIAVATSIERRSLAQQQTLATERTRLEAALRGGGVVSLSDVLFETGSATLKPGAALTLAPLADHLRANPRQQAVIQGHTDSIGSADYNESLSQARAEAVRGFLIAQGVAPQRLAARGFGENYPRASNDTAAGRQANRRVEVQLAEAP
ncbi:MAG: OmpA family protein, partial [Alphaproteobacteria bacterium]|nr:OmpA family protein [Alphaproteobacteria bacterium]